MVESAARKRVPRRRLLSIAVALALIAFVASRVPWRDVLLLEGPAGELAAPGRLIGRWQGQQASFAFASSATPEPSWPDEWRLAAQSGAPLPVERRAAGDDPGRGGLDWRPGLRTIFVSSDPRALLPALGVTLLGQLLVVTRWTLLLAIGRCATRWSYALRLTFLGLFFNLVVPGVTGGDVVKGALAVRDHPERRLATFTSVVIDRAIGLLAVLALAACALAWLGPAHAAARLRPLVFGALAVALVGFASWLFAPRALVERARRLPQGARLAPLIAAGRVHARHPAHLGAAFALSFANHLANAGTVYLLARGASAQLGPAAVTAATAIGSAAAAIPLSPGGLGVLEGAIGYLFALLGSTAALGVATALSWRLLLVALGLAGGLALFVPGAGRRGLREQAARAAAEA